MAGLLSKSEPKLNLEIRTKSVEQTLVPLVTQITTLVNSKERIKLTEKQQKALEKVGQAVSSAVDRFVSVGQSIAEEHPDIKADMCLACHDARLAGASIQKLTACYPGQDEAMTLTTDKTAMVRAARQLLSAITKVLLLADHIVVKQLLLSKEKVLASLAHVEEVNNFTDFVNAFSEFGKDMVELAHLSGDRQNDLKSDKHRAQMGSARAILEKSTMMLLLSCKTFLRHPECASARLTRQGVFSMIRQAQELIQLVVVQGGPEENRTEKSQVLNGDSGIGLTSSHPTASKAFSDFEDQIDMSRVTMIGPEIEDRLLCAFENVKEAVEEFTDSYYTSHEAREKIVQLSDSLRDNLQNLLLLGHNVKCRDGRMSTQDFETSVINVLEASKILRKQLLATAMSQASDLFRQNDDECLLKALKKSGLSGDFDRVEELTVKFSEHQEQLEEVCKLFRHMATTEPLIIAAEHNESFLHCLGPLILYAAHTLAQHPESKIARENLSVFSDAWENQINDLSILVKEVNDLCQGRGDKVVYLSLPRPGKHGTNSRALRPAKLDAEEQAKIAKLGLEMKLITSETEAEADKWEEPDNAVVKRAKNMSSMAFSMYLFTRGEGPLKTTHDLFVQAHFFAQEGNKLYSTIQNFAQRVPPCSQKEELLMYLDRIPMCCHQLITTLKSATFGKTATFNKVDSAIQETKNLMNIVAKVVTTCFVCATKYNIDYRCSPTPSSSCQLTRWSSGQRSSSDNESALMDNRRLSDQEDALFRSSSSGKGLSSLEKTG
ncbi:alpha-catulin [Biomphalaria glabrata]|uniref:Alpha-catulin-like n=1 Tax=Biomphalaria glabrata TaxID=6526 RepID=A0A2C9K2K2_BIOGL|nr:alpha-catulin-like [Biomphalaria glabrata]KAI8738521.1 alpha-catulin [Biomphalaria glabrata]KAI8739124.1 alpha-catulin-like [Biomphalaria glabrata]